MSESSVNKKIELIPTREVKSGEKFTTDKGVRAIKDGIKRSATASAGLKKPDWLRVRIHSTPQYAAVKTIVHDNDLATVCEEAKCPNISECWSAGTATIMLMGDVCTRACQFCAVNTGNPQGWLDPDEASRPLARCN